MPKRFTETTKWADPWFRALSPRHKLAWIYLCDNCDHAGVIELDRELADFQIGGDGGDWEALVESSAGRIEVLANGRLWLTKFVDFQFGSLSRQCAAHGPVFISLEKNGLLERVLKGLAKGSRTLKDKDKEKDKDKDKREGSRGGRFTPPTRGQVLGYCSERENSVDVDQFMAHYEANGWRVGRNPMRDWKAAVRYWERSEFSGTNGSKLSPGDRWLAKQEGGDG